MVYGRKRYGGKRRRGSRYRRRSTKVGRKRRPTKRYAGRRRAKAKSDSWKRLKIAGIFPRELTVPMMWMACGYSRGTDGAQEPYKVLPSIRVNSCHDPGVTSSTASMRYYQFYSNYYANYEVLSTKVTYTFSPYVIDHADPSGDNPECGPVMCVSKYDQDNTVLQPHMAAIPAGWLAAVGDPTVRMTELNLNRPELGGYPHGPYKITRRWKRSDLHPGTGNMSGLSPLNYSSFGFDPTATAFITTSLWPKDPNVYELTAIPHFQYTIRIDMKVKLTGLKDVLTVVA